MTKYEAMLEYVSALYEYGLISREKADELNIGAYKKYGTVEMTVTEAGIFKPAIEKIKKIGQKIVGQSDKQSYANLRTRQKAEKELDAAEESLKEAKARKDRKGIRDAEALVKAKTERLNKLGGRTSFVTKVLPDNNPRTGASTQNLSDAKREKKVLKKGYQELDKENDKKNTGATSDVLSKLNARKAKEEAPLYNADDHTVLDDGTVVRVRLSGETGEPYLTYTDQNGVGVKKSDTFSKNLLANNKAVKNLVASAVHNKQAKIANNNATKDLINSRSYERKTVDDYVAHDDHKFGKGRRAQKQFNKTKKAALKDLDKKNAAAQNVLSKDTALDVENQDRLREKKYEILKNRAKAGKEIPKKFLESMEELQDLIFEAFMNDYITDEERVYLLESVDEIMKENE